MERPATTATIRTPTTACVHLKGLEVEFEETFVGRSMSDRFAIIERRLVRSLADSAGVVARPLLEKELRFAERRPQIRQPGCPRVVAREEGPPVLRQRIQQGSAFA